MRHGLFCTLAVVILVVAGVKPIFAQQSTTGPISPPGIDRGIRRATSSQVTIPGVPAYLWHHGCGPTAVGMVVGYWDGNGFPMLVPGDASTQTAAVNAMIADDGGTPDCDAPDGNHFQDYSCPIDSWPDLLPDKSETGGAHPSNCVADFLKTSWSSMNNGYGWSNSGHIAKSFTDYVKWVSPEYTPIATNKSFHESYWTEYKAEIDSGRPVVMLVDTDGDGHTDHFVTGIGYDSTTTEYGIYDTWDTSIHWYTWRRMGPGNAWGIYDITLFRIIHCVTITDYDFVPQIDTVAIRASVRWTNNGAVIHSTTSDAKSAWDSDTLYPGESFTFQFNSAGSYPYHCKFHPSMTGTIVVKPLSDVKDESADRGKPSEFTLSQNYPNPFNQTTRIQFTMAKSGFVSLNIYDILGRKVTTLVSEHLSSGYKSVLWDGKNDAGKDVASGVYFYQLKVGDFSEPKKMLLLK